MINDFEWPVGKGGAYIMLETKTIWFWQLRRHLRDGWEIASDDTGGFRIKIERCIG